MRDQHVQVCTANPAVAGFTGVSTAVAPPAAVSSPPVVSIACGSCAAVARVAATGALDGAFRFTCPSCGAQNEFMLSSEQEDNGFVAEIPPWWQQSPAMGESLLLPVSQEAVDMIQTLVDRTWKDITTRDRSYAKVGRLQVVQVQQNHNPRLWQNYCRARENIRKVMREEYRMSVFTNEVQAADNERFHILGDEEQDVNEAMLFHGTKPSACENICKSDFMIKMAGTSAGMLYGPGIYFGENSSKSDEYATDEKSGIFGGLYAMLLCRVTCGRFYYTDEVNPDVQSITQSCTGRTAQYHCCLGDRAKARGTYREFIVFNADQAYPEYVIIYRREEAR